MDRKLALSLFLVTCIVLAILLIMQIISPLISSIIFAVALVVFGGTLARLPQRKLICLCDVDFGKDKDYTVKLI